MKTGTLEKADELAKEILSIEESLKALKHLKNACGVTYVSSPLTYHEIPFNDNVKGKILDIIELDLKEELVNRQIDFGNLQKENEVVKAILNHLNKAPETQPDGSVILKDRKG